MIFHIENLRNKGSVLNVRAIIIKLYFDNSESETVE